ncbi:MAG: HNH endonuclease, partial [Chloroflexi bacterium]|nr:HNH endonuclease [Chloroflexota bacterium]
NQAAFDALGIWDYSWRYHRGAISREVGLIWGIPAYNGVFHLVDSGIEYDGTRNVFSFKLIAVEDGDSSVSNPPTESPRRRVIPTAVKVEVWKRDGGKCTVCGAGDELHFDHILPYSKGGTSIKSVNVQLLCARHNLEKRDQII